MAADSSGIETDRYADAAVPGKKTLKETTVRVKPYLKWHILAVIGPQVILSCRTTPRNVNYTGVPPSLLAKAGRLGRSFGGWVFNAGKGYDPDGNCGAVIGVGPPAGPDPASLQAWQRASRKGTGPGGKGA